MRAQRLTAIATVALAIATTVSPAHADDRADKKKEAEKLFRAGERAFEAGRYDMAANAFERAFEVLPLPAIAFSAAQAYRLQYFRDREDARLKRAVELYRGYVESQVEGGRIKDAVANLAELEPLLARAEEKGAVRDMPRELKTQLVLSSPIKEARGSVDGGELHALPYDVVVEPGRHKIVISAPGYARFEREVDVVAGQMRAVEGNLEPRPVKLAISATAGARVEVDGRALGSAPLGQPIELDAGSHFLTVTKRGHRPFARQFVAGRGESVDYDADLSTTRKRKISYFFLGGSALFLASATVTGLVALGSDRKASDLDDKRESEGLSAAELAEYLDLRDKRDLQQNAALGLFITGAVLGGAGALLYYLDNPSPERPPATDRRRASDSLEVGAIAGPDTAGVALSGRF